MATGTPPWPREASNLDEGIKWANEHWPLWLGFFIEFVMTFLLLLTVRATTDEEAHRWVPEKFAGFFIAIYVGFACFITPMTMTCMNPARDWGPRVVSAMLGYPGHVLNYRWEVPIVYGIPQFLGGICGVAFWKYVLKPYFAAIKE